jgi:Cellulose binding domain
MGRHSKDAGDGAPPDGGPRRSRRVGKVPLLPTVTGVMVVGVVVSALSTKQIALNFAGGPPSAMAGQPPQVAESAPAAVKSGRRAARDDSSLGPRGHASRGYGREVITVRFQKVSESAAGFHGRVTITNHGRTAVSGWTLTFGYPGTRIVSVHGARAVHDGAAVTARNPSARPSIPPGGTATLSFTAKGTGTRPSACTFNGATC